MGGWSGGGLIGAGGGRKAIQVHAFEPASATFKELASRLLPEFTDSVVLLKSAASDHNGHATLFKVHELAGSNSLHGIAGSTEGLTPETIDLCTLDDYCGSKGSALINLLRIDAEGHDHLGLTGARTLLAKGAVETIQFEYNDRWIGARRYLKDVFDDLKPIRYV